MPSHQLRPTLGKARRSRPVWAATCSVLALVVSLALSSCGGQAADAAAIVDGTVISDKDVQTVSRQLNTLAQGKEQFAAKDVLFALIIAPYVTAEVNRAGTSVPDAQVLKAIENVPDRSVALVDYIRLRLAFPALDQPSQARIVQKLGQAKITVNPRYGSFDPKQIAITPSAPNWIKAGSETPAR